MFQDTTIFFLICFSLFIFFNALLSYFFLTEKLTAIKRIFFNLLLPKKIIPSKLRDFFKNKKKSEKFTKKLNLSCALFGILLFVFSIIIFYLT